MKKSIAALAVLASVASAPSQAAIYNVGTLTATPYTATVPYAPGAFTDHFNFTQSAGFAGMAGGVVPLSLNFGFIGTVDTSISSAELFAGTAASPGSLVGSYANAFSQNLSAGNYFLKLTGLSFGTLGGGYTVSLNATSPAAPAPVPEPETWVMLALGAALMGFQARRKPEADAMGFAV